MQRAQNEREEMSERRQSTALNPKLSKEDLADLLQASADEARVACLHCLTQPAAAPLQPDILYNKTDSQTLPCVASGSNSSRHRSSLTYALLPGLRKGR